MTERALEESPQIYARIAGVLYLIIIVLGMFAEVVREQVVVSGDAGATARNILAHEMLYRLGFVADIVTFSCAIPLLLILYDFIKLVSARLALLAAFLNLVSIAIEGANMLNHFAPLIFLSGRHYLTVFTTEQLQVLAYLCLRFQSVGYNISLTVFGLFCIVTGYLIFRSTFLPPILGLLYAIAGVCYPINAFADFLFPALSGYLFPWILVPCFIGELAVCLWLLVMGVNVPKWEEKANGWRVSGAMAVIA